MSQKKIIAVIGATGAQGGGLARAIAADPHGPFTARAITRNTGSDKAKALAAAGIEVVAGDADHPASLDAAFRGAYGAFCVTNFWEHNSVDREGEQASAMARATRKAGLQHVIWSTLEDTREIVPLTDPRMPVLHGKYNVPHFDSKGQVDRVFTTEGAPTTFLRAAFYWDNFIYFGAGPKRGADGQLAITMPIGNAKMAGVAAEDVGKVAYGIFKQGPSLVGKKIGVAGEHLTGDQIAQAMTKKIGKTITFNNVEPNVYRSFGFPGADDLGNMFQFYRDFEQVCNDMRNVERARELAPGLQTFDQWLSAHAKEIPLE